MSMFKDCPHFEKHDDYYTASASWDMIEPYIKAKGFKRVYEACMLNSTLSKSPQYWKDKGYEVIYNYEWNFLEHEEPKENYDCIITNPPFNLEIKLPILKKLIEIDKPFCLIMNVCNVFAKYFNDLFKEKQEHLEIIFPRGKILFEKMEWKEGKQQLIKTKAPAFYCVFVCYKMDLGIKML